MQMKRKTRVRGYNNPRTFLSHFYAKIFSIFHKIFRNLPQPESNAIRLRFHLHFHLHFISNDSVKLAMTVLI